MSLVLDVLFWVFCELLPDPYDFMDWQTQRNLADTRWFRTRAHMGPHGQKAHFAQVPPMHRELSLHSLMAWPCFKTLWPTLWFSFGACHRFHTTSLPLPPVSHRVKDISCARLYGPNYGFCLHRLARKQGPFLPCVPTQRWSPSLSSSIVFIGVKCLLQKCKEAYISAITFLVVGKAPWSNLPLLSGYVWILPIPL